MARRREFTRDTAAEIMRRCERPTGFQCEECGVIVSKGEIDHTIAEALVLDKSKKLTANDGKFLCWDCHQGPDGKTPKDKAIIGAAKRNEAKRMGIETPPRATIPAPAPRPKEPKASRIMPSEPEVVNQSALYRAWVKGQDASQ